MHSRRWLWIVVMALLVLGAPLPVQAVPAPWPGLPDSATGNLWVGVQGNGLSEARRARQWLKIPNQATAVGQRLESDTFPIDDPQDRNYSHRNTVRAFLSSPTGADFGYGEGLPVTVHTTAFGAIPVRARIQMRQVRDAEGLPIPLIGTDLLLTYRTPQYVRPGVTSMSKETTMRIRGQVRVRVLDLVVDGVDLELQGTCQTRPIDLDLGGIDTWVGDPMTDPKAASPPIPIGTASATWLAQRNAAILTLGGASSGLVVIPAFSGCRTRSGEDLSALLTGSLSGPGNQVRVGFSPIGLDNYCGSKIPPFMFVGTRGPFAGDPSDCDPTMRPPEFDYPTRP